MDDIDHLGNRRVRAVGELLENQFRIGLVRMERAIKEKMSVYQEMSTAMPHDLVNAKPVMAAIREFFGSSQLSQFMDQTNPLSEITHKRRLSALGPGGLSRERAGFEVRDVHPTHYGRICPIETPEGPNIGLISSLSCFARINEYGFIESPYRKVVKGVGDRRSPDPQPRRYRSTRSATSCARAAGREGQPQAERQEAGRPSSKPTASTSRPGKKTSGPSRRPTWSWTKRAASCPNSANARQAGNFVLKNRDEIEYIDVSPKQLVSVAASLIPFLENDDANRALMGSNMQRQAVPLLRADAPYVGTGMEQVTARDSGAVVLCKRAGMVDSVDSERIIVRVEGSGARRPALARSGRGHLPAHQVQALATRTPASTRSRSSAWASGSPRAPVLADGPCTDIGELALGRNVLVAFMPWRGYNFEDAILVSEKLVKEDYYTSIHIEEFEIEARDTKLGPEEITRDIPNIADSLPAQPGRERHHPHRRHGEAGRHSGGQGHARRAKPSSLRKRNCSARSSAKRPAT